MWVKLLYWKAILILFQRLCLLRLSLMGSVISLKLLWSFHFWNLIPRSCTDHMSHYFGVPAVLWSQNSWVAFTSFRWETWNFLYHLYLLTWIDLLFISSLWNVLFAKVLAKKTRAVKQELPAFGTGHPAESRWSFRGCRVKGSYGLCKRRPETTRQKK